MSHRSAAFLADFQAARRQLCRLANARHVQVLMGSGTLANDAIAAQLAAWPGPGLILSNGAFGERLIDHATRLGLTFRTLHAPWGAGFDRRSVAAALDAALGGSVPACWVWAVHGETSTGVLNDLPMLREVAAARGARLCIDAVSSLGTAPTELSGVALASGVSGKGLAALPGLALVFHESPLVPVPSLPRYLDLGWYSQHEGIPFTLSSPLLYALKAAVERCEPEEHERFGLLARLAEHLRAGLRELALRPVATPASWAAVTTIALPPGHNSVVIGQRLEEEGYLLNYRSGYLPPRNWLQICLMGICSHLMIDQLLGALRRAISLPRAPGNLPDAALPLSRAAAPAPATQRGSLGSPV